MSYGDGKIRKPPRGSSRKPPRRLTNYRKAVKLEEGLTIARLKGEMKFKKGKKALEKSVKDHIGKLIDRVEPIDAFIIAALAYVGYERTGDWRGALIGPIGYKLATTMGGTPPVSQIAGLIILGELGLLVAGEGIPPVIKIVEGERVVVPPGQWGIPVKLP